MIAERAAEIAELSTRFRALRADEIAAEIARITHLLNNQTCEPAPTNMLDVADKPRADVAAWLAGLNLPNTRVHACWISLREGVEMQLSDFVRHYDELWLPGADDVCVSDPNGQFVLFFDHEERITAWCQTCVDAASHASN